MSAATLGEHVSDYDPAWSPNGRKIVSVSDPAGCCECCEIYVTNVSDSQRTRLTNTPKDQYGYRTVGSPTWSPDSRKIAFVRYRGPDELPSANIYVMNPNGTGETKLTSVGSTGTALSWSPDGTKIAFTSSRSVSCGDCSSVYDIIVVNANGTGRTNITRSLWGGAGAPNWGPLDNTKAPKVSSVEPHDLATDVPLTANIVATFLKAVNPTKINTATLTLRRQDTDQLVNAQVQYLPATREAILDPEGNLLPGTTYIATVRGGPNGVLDTTLNPMASDKVCSFTVSG